MSGGTTRRVLIATLLLVVAVSLFVRLAEHDQFTQDTTAVIDGSRRTLTCLGEGQFTRCRYHADEFSSGVNPYPLLQYVPGIVLVGAGADDQTTRDALTWLNTLAIVAAILLIARRAFQRGGAELSFLATLAMTTGMLVPYAGASVGEPLLLVALLVACRLAVAQTPTAWLAIAAAATMLGKETIAPVVVLYVVGFVLLAGGPSRVLRAKALWATSGVVVGVLLNTAFNVFRFGTVRNVQYLHQAETSEPLQALKAFVSLGFAPNGGAVWFWWLGVVAVVVIIVAALRGQLARAQRTGVVMILGGLVVGLATLAFWWAPFGWYSWGPRLAMPLLPPLVLAAVELWPRVDTRFSARVKIATVVVALVLMVPALAMAFAPEPYMAHWLATVEEHPECWAPDMRTDAGADLQHNCVMDAAWRTSSMPLVETVRSASEHEWLWYWATVIAALAAAVLAGISMPRRSRDLERDHGRVPQETAERSSQ